MRRNITTMVFTIGFIILLLSVPFTASAADRAEPLIIDHTCTTLETIPTEWIEAAKSQLRLCYGHTSHGSQPVSGMQVLMDNHTDIGRYDFNTDGALEQGILSLDDTIQPENIGYAGWTDEVRSYLDGPGSDRNLALFSWCNELGGATEVYVERYLTDMSLLELDYPEVTFIYMTGHVNGEESDGNLHQRNQQIRAYCLANNKVLYDFGDIERYDPDGTDFLDLGADDGCNYDGGNWAEEWCAENPGSELCIDCVCSHSHPLNCNLKGRAFWWMFARLAGWNPSATKTVNCGLVCQPTAGTLPLPVRFNATLTNSYTGFTRRLAGRIDVVLPNGTSISRWRAGTANIDAGTSLVTTWFSPLPATQAMVGDSTFTFVGMDVTPSPFNQPPHPPSGDSDSAGCVVTGLVP